MATSGLTAPLPMARVVDGLAAVSRFFGAALPAALRGAGAALDFLAAGLFTRALRAEACFVGVFLAGAFLAGAFFAGAFLAGVFLTGAFLMGAFLTGDFLMGALLAAGPFPAFFVAVLFVLVVAAAAPLAVTFFLGAAFPATDFFVAFFDELPALEPDADFAAVDFVAGLLPAVFLVAVFFICEPSCAEKQIPR